MKLRIFSFVLSVLFVTACGNSNSSNDSEKSPDSSNPNVTISGLSPDEFMKQFDYKKDDTGYHAFLSPSDNFSYAKLNDDGTKRATLIVKIVVSNRSFEAKYQELNNFKVSGNMTSYESSNPKFITGTYSIDKNGYIIFPGVGKGSGLTYNQKPAIAMVFEKDLDSAGLQGKNMTIQMSWHSSSEF